MRQSKAEHVARVKALAGVKAAATRWLDQATFAAVQDGVPYRTLGAILGVSPQTVANKYTQQITQQPRRQHP